MPFVPLGSRKRVEVILDHDKERLSDEMKTKDNATVKLHHQVMPGATGATGLSYRYANHPITMGPVRGPAPPFKGANKPWDPAEHDPNGMAAMRDLDQAPIGGFLEGSHCLQGETLRKTRSVPSMVRTLAANPVKEGDKSLGEQAKEAAQPLSIELRRWEKLAAVTKRDLASMPDLICRDKKTNPPAKKPVVIPGSLVNFPKYALFENSHLKRQDFQRFVAQEEQARQEHEAREAALEAFMGEGDVKDIAMSPSPGTTSRVSWETPASEVLVPYASASWGQPRLRGPKETIRNQWAGSAMPSGRAQRSSNPFRMG